MGERLAEKVALITGGGGGIGQATAELFAAEGARVAVVDVDADAAAEVAGEIGTEQALACGAALDEEPEAERAVGETVRRFGRLDVLANIAAVRVYGPVTEADPASWDFILRSNLLAAAFCSKFAIPEMSRNGGGSIINVSSANALSGRSGMAQYDATKSALLALTRDMACDHAAEGIRVNALCPGPTITGFHIRRRARQKEISLEQAEAEIRCEGAAGTLLNRQAEPREVAYPILFLSCDESSYVTGATYLVDGGLSV